MFNPGDFVYYDGNDPVVVAQEGYAIVVTFDTATQFGYPGDMGVSNRTYMVTDFGNPLGPFAQVLSNPACLRHADRSEVK